MPRKVIRDFLDVFVPPTLVQNFKYDVSDRVSRFTPDLSDNSGRPVSGDVLRYRVNRTRTKEAGNKTVQKHRVKNLHPK
jgi:hypothetical protein